MCGVIGLIYERNRDDLGVIAGMLLKTLEYRGYDSTGAAIQSHGNDVVLRKDVGAPSVMVQKLGIDELPGQILCGQVRWATFGAVDQANAQPHVVRCHTYIYGAHNGNVTNTDAMKLWLQDRGHHVVSDNDGEIVVHTVEHYFAERLQTVDPTDHSARRACMRQAIISAADVLKGSFASVVVDPISRTGWAIKAGSSLYFGVGEDDKGGRFAIASSDLSSVLKLTRVLVPMVEGEVAEFDGVGHHQIYNLRSTPPGETIDRRPIRSRLRAKDTALVPPFAYYMEQEIAAQVANTRDIIGVFNGGSPAAHMIGPVLDVLAPDELSALHREIDQLRDQYDDVAIRSQFQQLQRSPAFQLLLGRLPSDFRNWASDVSPSARADQLRSAESGFLADVLALQGDEAWTSVLALDAFIEREEVRDFAQSVTGLCNRILETEDRGGRIYIVCCGTSYHAAKAACLFFSALASTEVLALLPGEFRGQYAETLRDGDLLIAMSQSGETKDLIDIVNDCIASQRDIFRVAIVNNVNSTLAQEKSHLVLPLHCGPEIAVPATKSFVNQLTVLYELAVRLAERRITSDHVVPGQARSDELSRRHQSLPDLPTLIEQTIRSTEQAVEEAADLLYLAPSIHLLATRLLAVAKEGALKIREVVLNHTEGFEGSEFKHGPNTILGVNTLYGPLQVQSMLDVLGDALAELIERSAVDGVPPSELAKMTRTISGGVFRSTKSVEPNLQGRVDDAFDRPALIDALYEDYPLVFITGPDERDVALTVSQLNTHKIRGASTVVIAEENAALRTAATKPPADNQKYRSVYIPLPKTGDTMMTVFSATVALQCLALEMSVRKLAYLNALGVQDHGVHPDVPKNVSKSITVD